jgi:hypothetical protein
MLTAGRCGTLEHLVNALLPPFAGSGLALARALVRGGGPELFISSTCVGRSRIQDQTRALQDLRHAAEVGPSRITYLLSSKYFWSVCADSVYVVVMAYEPSVSV